jgi:hypothetical protein
VQSLKSELFKVSATLGVVKRLVTLVLFRSNKMATVREKCENANVQTVLTILDEVGLTYSICMGDAADTIMGVSIILEGGLDPTKAPHVPGIAEMTDVNMPNNRRVLLAYVYYEKLVKEHGAQKIKIEPYYLEEPESYYVDEVYKFKLNGTVICLTLMPYYPPGS